MIVCLTLKLRKSKNEVAKACVMNSGFDISRETIVPNLRTVEIPNAFEVWRIELQNEQGVKFESKIIEKSKQLTEL